MITLRAVPDPTLGHESCEWCGGAEDLGRLRNERMGIEYVTCYRCYRIMFEGKRLPVY